MFGIYNVTMLVGNEIVIKKVVLRDRTAEIDAKNWFGNESVISVEIEDFHPLVADIANDAELADLFNKMYLIKA